MIKLEMEDHLFLSIVNMKLRNDYESLDDLCEDNNLNRFEVEKKLKEIDYVYVEGQNQFKSVQ